MSKSEPVAAVRYGTQQAALYAGKGFKARPVQENKSNKPSLKKGAGEMSVTSRKFGELTSGEEIRIYHLENPSGAYAEVMEFGAILVKLCVPDKNGVLRDVVLGYDDLQQYEVNSCYFGATIGRNGNRIENGKFCISGKEIVIPQNENGNNLHSGPDGFEKKVWSVSEVSDEKNSVTFYRVSADGENGFPGEFRIRVKYEFTKDNELKIQYSGVCDEDTVANLTNHSYFNLAGEGSGDVLAQSLKIQAQYYTPVKDSKSIPTGECAPVEGTPMDFRQAKPIGRDIEADFDQLKYTQGFDHNYVTDNYSQGSIRHIASAYCEESGIAMNVSSDLPCVQFYAGNFVTEQQGKNGHTYGKRHGFCLETQVEPNAVNEESFHSPVLEAGEQYNSVTAYRFYVK